MNIINLGVCKIMWLNTLYSDEWLVCSWALKAEERISTRTETEVFLRTKLFNVVSHEFEEIAVF